MGRRKTTPEAATPAAPDVPAPRFARLHPKADALLERLPLESLRSICEDDGYPSKSTVLVWAQKDAEFQIAYAEAMTLRAHATADDAAYIREQVSKGLLVPDQARVMLDSVKWESGKRLPRVYGDRLQTEVTGANGGAIEHAVTHRLPAATQRLLDSFTGRGEAGGAAVPGAD